MLALPVALLLCQLLSLSGPASHQKLLVPVVITCSLVLVLSLDWRRFSGLFVGGVGVAGNSGLSHLVGAGKRSLPPSYHLDRPALRYTNTNLNTRAGHFTTASKRPDWLNCVSSGGISWLKARSVSTQKSQEIEGRASNHGRQGRAPPAHFLFGQRSVGKDSKGLCAIFSVFEMGTTTYFRGIITKLISRTKWDNVNCFAL